MLVPPSVSSGRTREGSGDDLSTYPTVTEGVSVNEGDLRVRRTRAMLRNALISLVAEVGYEAVTVRGLTERALDRKSVV